MNIFKDTYELQKSNLPVFGNKGAKCLETNNTTRSRSNGYLTSSGYTVYLRQTGRPGRVLLPCVYEQLTTSWLIINQGELTSINMAHPRATELRARNAAGVFGGEVNQDNNLQRYPRNHQPTSDEAPLLDEEALLSKHEMAEQQAIEIELEKTGLTRKEGEQLCFRDGVKLIDYILVFETPAADCELDEDDQKKEDTNAEKRKKYEASLKELGLELEFEEGISTKVRLDQATK